MKSAASYASEIQSKLAISQSYAAEAGIRLQVDTTKYQWYQAQLQSLKQDYTTGIQMLMGPKMQLPKGARPNDS